MALNPTFHPVLVADRRNFFSGFVRLAAIEPSAKISLYASFYESNEGKFTKGRLGGICTLNAHEMIDVGADKIRGQCTTVLVATVAPAAKRPPISNESCQCFQCRMGSLFRLKFFFFGSFHLQTSPVAVSLQTSCRMQRHLNSASSSLMKIYVTS